jgi:hypothetical protein
MAATIQLMVGYMKNKKNARGITVFFKEVFYRQVLTALSGSLTL